MIEALSSVCLQETKIFLAVRDQESRIYEAFLYLALAYFLQMIFDLVIKLFLLDRSFDAAAIEIAEKIDPAHRKILVIIHW